MELTRYDDEPTSAYKRLTVSYYIYIYIYIDIYRYIYIYIVCLLHVSASLVVILRDAHYFSVIILYMCIDSKKLLKYILCNAFVGFITTSYRIQFRPLQYFFYLSLYFNLFIHVFLLFNRGMGNLPRFRQVVKKRADLLTPSSP
jgi:hypothetical protein